MCTILYEKLFLRKFLFSAGDVPPVRVPDRPVPLGAIRRLHRQGRDEPGLVGAQARLDLKKREQHTLLNDLRRHWQDIRKGKKKSIKFRVGDEERR